MKRLNKKGFTLVELLAVIIILAVVVGITIPAVLTAVGGAKESQFETASKTAADWFDRQYQSYMVGDSSISAVNANFKTFCDVNDATFDAAEVIGGNSVGGDTNASDGTIDDDRDGNFKCAYNLASDDATKKALIASMGLTSANIADITVVFEEGRSCVTLFSAAGGDYDTDNYPAGSASRAGGACVNNIGLTKKTVVGTADFIANK